MCWQGALARPGPPGLGCLSTQAHLWLPLFPLETVSSCDGGLCTAPRGGSHLPQHPPCQLVLHPQHCHLRHRGVPLPSPQLSTPPKGRGWCNGLRRTLRLISIPISSFYTSGKRERGCAIHDFWDFITSPRLCFSCLSS